eukprot:g26146.t1
MRSLTLPKSTSRPSSSRRRPRKRRVLEAEGAPREGAAPARLSKRDGRARAVAPHAPMWVVPLEGVLDMTTLKTHEELQQDGILVPFNPKDGSAIFVSHQWAGVEHPDPHFEQFKVLQESLKNVLCGASTFHSNLSMELYMMPSEPISAKDLLARPLFIWYDYFSCPQCTSSSNDRDLAINRALEALNRQYVRLHPPF